MSPRDQVEATISRNGSELTLSSTQKAKKSVSFGNVHIREYNRIISDHPDCKVGPPIGLGWEFAEHSPKTIQEYEENRAPRRLYLRLSSITRKNMLTQVFGYSEEETRLAEKEIQKIQKLREQSLKQNKTSEKVEEVLQSTKRKFTRKFSPNGFLRGLAAASNAFVGPFSVPI